MTQPVLHRKLYAVWTVDIIIDSIRDISREKHSDGRIFEITEPSPTLPFAIGENTIYLLKEKILAIYTIEWFMQNGYIPFGKRFDRLENLVITFIMPVQ
jgi:hypothetical protein